ncbi:suppressor of cytokine signaling 2-like isoform X2 [Conger conger]|uniref:suppressor of cytokine signaling 2-like isoform X2 n=1 Tax=Conger conger TaxID=82655 RepID=UPI002A5AF355|nr:suppressor of cytokine signaling 2-like isoform X2 [Conger conger]
MDSGANPCNALFWMGHMQCVSQTPETRTETPRLQGRGRVPGSSRRPTPRPSDVPMILPNLIPGKSLAPIRLKDQSLELRRGGSTVDAPRVERALAHLQESGWYWGPITATEAKELLSEADEGTFLLRDSSNPGYLLTLSVRTSLGPTHLRIEWSGGQFGFDSLALARPRLRRFGGAVELVEHYALACSHPRPAGQEEEEDAPDRSLQLRLLRPLRRAAPSLQHLCRIAINQHSHTPRDLPLPGRLKDFLQEYPFLL